MSFCYSPNHLLFLTEEVINELVTYVPQIKDKMKHHIIEIRKIRKTNIYTFNKEIKIYDSEYSDKFTELNRLSALVSWKYNRNEYYNHKLIKDIKKSVIDFKGGSIGGGFFSNLAKKLVFKFTHLESIFGSQLQKSMLNLVENEEKFKEEKSKDDLSFTYFYNYVIFSGLDKNSKLKNYKFNKKNNYFDFIKNNANKSISPENFGFLLMYFMIIVIHALAHSENFGKDLNKIFDIFLKDEMTMVFEIKDLIEKDSAILCSVNEKKKLTEEFVIHFFRTVLEKKRYYFRDNDIDEIVYYDKKPRDRLKNFMSVIENAFESFKIHHPNLAFELKEMSPLKIPPDEIIEKLIINYFSKFDQKHNLSYDFFPYNFQIIYSIFNINNVPQEIINYFTEYPLLEIFCKKISDTSFSIGGEMYARSVIIEKIENISKKVFKKKIDINEILSMRGFKKIDQNILNDIRDTYIEIGNRSFDIKTQKLNINKKYVVQNFDVNVLPVKFKEYAEKYPDLNKLYLNIYKEFLKNIIIKINLQIERIMESEFKRLGFKYIRLF